MADRKISELTNITGADLADADEFALVDTSADETKAITFGEFKTALDTATGFVRITGDTMTGNLNIGLINQSNRTFFMGSGYGSYFDIGTSLNSTLITSGSATSDTTLKFRVADGGTETTIVNVSKAGVDVTGTITADGLTVDGTTNTDALDLNAIAATISDTAVDIFVYDTRKDSDGGAWRKRTQHTSWYNEAASSTRGSRKEFPAVAVIVAESNQVTIYDGDDPDLPMWMVFNHNSVFDLLRNISQGHVSSTYALNGSIFVTNANGNGLSSVSFLDDTGFFFNTSNKMVYNGSVSQREEQLNHTAIKPTGIINGSVNDVAMTVLPNAPIDAATGLPVPTIAVATDGGLSVITDSGAVYDNVQGTQGYDYVVFDNENGVYFRRNTTTGLMRYASAAEYTSGDGFGAEIARTTAGTNDFDLLTWGSMSSYPDGFAMGGGSTTGDAVSGLMLRYANLSDRAKGMSALTTSSYNTGWMNGDIKLATLSDTDDTNVTGSELVTNGTFDSDVSGWTASTGATVTYDSGRMKVAQGASDDYVVAYQAITTVVGKTYTVSFDTIDDGSSSTGSTLYVRTTPTSGNIVTGGSGFGSHALTFTATATTTYISAGLGTSANNVYVLYDNVSVRLAEEDRSVNGNGLQVFGTVTKSAVNSGADLVGYTDFSDNTNYFYQPPNADMDFGTGDFSVMLWHYYENATLNDTIYFAAGKSSEYTWQVGAAGSDSSYLWIIGGSINARSAANSVIEQAWTHLTYVRRNGVTEIWVNGVLIETDTDTTDLNSNLGIEMPLSSAVGDGDDWMALLRISATAPSPEAIKRIYEDEKVLFQENAKAVLYGTSDAVTALAFDDTTNLLHVGTSAGRSVFQGLRRVDNTTTGVTTAISASNGLVVDQ